MVLTLSLLSASLCVSVVGGISDHYEEANGSRAILTHAHTPCQSRLDRWPTTVGWVAEGIVAKKLRKTEGILKPACDQSCNT